MILKRHTSGQKSTSGMDSCDGIGPGSYDDDRTTSNSVEDMTDRVDSGAIAGDPYEKDTTKVNSVGSAAQKANQSLQHLQILRNSIHTSSISGRHTPTPNQYAPIQSNEVSKGQILGVRNLRGSMGQILLSTDRPAITPSNAGIVNVPTNPTVATPMTPGPHYTKPNDGALLNDKARENERISIVDRGNTEFQIVPDNMLTTINVKKNVKGVKLVGMEGGTLRRPSLQVSDSDVTSL